MKTGKVSESILKRSVLRQLHMKNANVITGAGIGHGYAAVRAEENECFIFATNPVTWEISDSKIYAVTGIYSVLNNVLSSGAVPVGVLVDVLLPTRANEVQLRELMKEMDYFCGQSGIQIIGGHTQVTRAVKTIVVTVTGVGKTLEKDLISNQNIKPGMDIIVTKWIGLLGTLILAEEREQELRERYSQSFLDKAKAFVSYLSVESEAAVAVKSGVCGMHDISEGGVFGALWEMAEAAGVGLDIEIKKIPIRQETVEISEFFNINPYKLLSGGSFLIVSEDGNCIVREIEKAGQNAVIIGMTTDSNDRVLFQGDERRFLETAQTDELYKVLKGE